MLENQIIDSAKALKAFAANLITEDFVIYEVEEDKASGKFYVQRQHWLFSKNWRYDEKCVASVASPPMPHWNAVYANWVLNSFTKHDETVVSVDSLLAAHEPTPIKDLAAKYCFSTLGAGWSLQAAYKLEDPHFIDTWLNGNGVRYGFLDPRTASPDDVHEALASAVHKCIAAFSHING